MNGKISKEDLIRERLDSIVSTATRKSRGTDEHEYLVRDLDNIVDQAELIKQILADPRPFWTDREVSGLDLEDMRKAATKAVEKQNSSFPKIGEIPIPVKPELVADIRGKIDGCALWQIVGHFKVNGGEIQHLWIAKKDTDLAVLGAFGVEPLVSGVELQRVAGLLLSEGWAELQPANMETIAMWERGVDNLTRQLAKAAYTKNSDSVLNQAIDCFYAPPMYFIQFRGKKWI